MLAKRQGQEYQILLAFLDEASANRFRENLVRNPANGIKEYAVPSERGKGFQPWGTIFTPQICELLLDTISSDPDVAESILKDIADRMDSNPAADYVFPDLSPDVYAAVRNAQKKKPN